MEPPHVPPVVDALQARSCPTPPCSPSATDAAITCTMTSGEDNTTVADAYDGTDAPGTSQKALIVDDEYRDGDGYASADQIDMNYSDIEKGDYTPVFHVNPPAVTPERFRDFRGPFTIHRFISFAWVLGVCVSLYFIQRLIWPPDALDSPYRNSWIANPYLGLILFIALPSSILSFIGAIWFRYNPNLDKVQPMEHNVVFRIVSRGINQECLLETIRCCQQEMRRNAYFPYLIEVVTDADVFEAPDEPDVIHLRVPPSYVTQNDTRFKARALNYACEYSLVPGNSWLVHLDEETRPTSSAIKGIAAMVADCERRGDITRIGQGCILYHRAFMQHKFLTLADSRRTGDDFGHFFLQHRIGVTMFGLHGAFIVCRQDTEAKLGFDIGPKGSITEDAWWILLAMKQGYRTAWVDGFLDEQATQSISDFLKQRRRWNYGLIKVITRNPAPLHYRLCLAWFVLTWVFVPFILPLQLGYTISLIVLDLPIPLWVRLPTIFVLSMQFYVYFIGWVVNVRENGTFPWWKIVFWTVVQVALVPVFLLMEIVAVVISFFAGCTQNGRGFHVVQKSATKDATFSDDDEELSSSS